MIKFSTKLVITGSVWADDWPKSHLINFFLTIHVFVFINNTPDFCSSQITGAS